MLNLFQHPLWRRTPPSAEMDPRIRSGAGSETSSGCLLVVSCRVMVGAEEVQRDVGLIADNPAVVPRRNVKDIASAHFEHPAVVHRRGRAARHDHADMFDPAGALAERGADMDRPFPAGLIGRAAD